MKTIAYWLILLFTSSILFAQTPNFEGKITYEMDYKMHAKNIDNKTFKEIMGSRNEMYYKNNNILSISDGKAGIKTIYNPKSELIYIKANNTASYIVKSTMDTSFAFVIREIGFQKKDTTILGIVCDRIKLQGSHKSMLLWVDTNLGYTQAKLQKELSISIDSSFSTCSANIALMKFIIKAPDYDATYTAIEYKPMKVADEMFAIEDPTQNWQEYSSKEGNFSMLMPQKPTESMQEVNSEIGNLNLYMSMLEIKDAPNDNLFYATSYVEYPMVINSDSLSQDELYDFYDNMISSAIKPVKGELVSYADISINNYMGIEYNASILDGNAHATYHIYLVKNRLYMLQVMYENERADNLQAIAFLDSFRLLNK